MGEGYGPARPAYARVNESVRWSEALGAEIVARAAAGETVRGMGRTAGLPQAQTILRWIREKPDFAEAMDLARLAAGNPFGPAVSAYCEETALAIYERLCGGEGMIAICRDADMPAMTTVQRWMQQQPEFARVIALARGIQAEAMVQRGWDWCAAATPETAYLLKVKLGQLRWHAGKIAPKKFGAIKAVEPNVDRRKVLHVYTKNFVLPRVGPDGRYVEGDEGHWSEEPAQHLYSMVAVDSPVDAGEKLPPPEVVREPLSAQPGGDRLARGGAVEAEVEEVEDCGGGGDGEAWL